MTINRVSVCDWGGIEVYDSRHATPVYFNPSLVTTCFADLALTTAGQTRLDQVIADRLAAEEIAANMQEVLG